MRLFAFLLASASALNLDAIGRNASVACKALETLDVFIASPTEDVPEGAINRAKMTKAAIEASMKRKNIHCEDFEMKSTPLALTTVNVDYREYYGDEDEFAPLCEDCEVDETEAAAIDDEDEKDAVRLNAANAQVLCWVIGFGVLAVLVIGTISAGLTLLLRSCLKRCWRRFRTRRIDVEATEIQMNGSATQRF